MDRGGHIHLLVIGPVLLSFTPCGDYYSLDCVLSRFYSSPSRNSGRKRNYNFLKQKEKRQKKRANGELWALPLLATQMMVVYYWAAWTKTNSGFLNGDRTEQLWAYTYNGMDWAQIPYFHEMNLLSSIGTVALEYLLAFYYLFPSAFQKVYNSLFSSSLSSPLLSSPLSPSQHIIRHLSSLAFYFIWLFM